jgi:hypothetical protein
MEERFIVGHSYLIKPKFVRTLQEVKVLKMSQTAYKLRYEEGGVSWVEKNHFWEEHNLQEDLGNLDEQALADAAKTFNKYPL